MDFHAFLYAVVGRRHELEQGMAGKDPVLFQRMLKEIELTPDFVTTPATSVLGYRNIICRSRASRQRRVFLDGRPDRGPRIFERCRIIPCFALSDERGRFIIRLYPPGPPARAEIMSGFGQRYAGYLRDHPEFAQIWKNVAQKRKEW